MQLLLFFVFHLWNLEIIRIIPKTGTSIGREKKKNLWIGYSRCWNIAVHSLTSRKSISIFNVWFGISSLITCKLHCFVTITATVIVTYTEICVIITMKNVKSFSMLPSLLIVFDYSRYCFVDFSNCSTTAKFTVTTLLHSHSAPEAIIRCFVYSDHVPYAVKPHQFRSNNNLFHLSSGGMKVEIDNEF